MRRIWLIGWLLTTWLAAQLPPAFEAGVGRRDITPREPVPMWGYAARHDALSEGVLDPLYAEALVIRAGGAKLAIVGLDLGRAPAEPSLVRIRRRLREQAGIEWSFIAGSHTHHGPVLELSDQPGKGRERFAAALRYYAELEDKIVEAVLEAEARRVPARVDAGILPLEGFNRNRHSKFEPKPVDRDLAVLRLDDAAGKPLALLVNFAAHPTMLPSSTLKFSADWVGAMKQALRRESGAAVVFMQGAAGDLSVNPGPGKDFREYGEAVARQALDLARRLRPEPPESPALEVREERFRFESRTDFADPLVRTLFAKAFFPELIANYLDEYAEGVRPRLTVALLNGRIGFVGLSGEVFSAHAVRLKQRARLTPLFFFGYSNGYHQYFPTIEAVAEGGYGADAAVSPVAVGAGERLMDAALVWLYRMLGRIRP